MGAVSKKEKLYYLKRALFHPFDGFYEIRFRNKGSVGIAAILLVLYGILQCISYQYTGFIVNEKPLHEMDSISIFISSITILLLLVVSNWTVTTLFNGKGKLKDIFIVVCYSLIPLIVVESVYTFASNFIIEEEAMILSAIRWLGIAWMVFLILGGLCVIHEYSFGLNLVTLVITAVAAVILVFLGVLFFTLMERMISFFSSVLQEFMRRM